jgi:hypothetical protein
MGARELQALLREIKNVRSPVQRMKLMALAWRTVARLSPAERKELGSKLGVRGYERILEKLGPGPQGIAPAEVLRALDGAEELDSSKLRGLVRGLRDPEQRKELLRQGLDFLDRSLAEEDEPVEIEAEEPVEEAGAPEEATERTVTAEELRPPEPVPAPSPEREPVEVRGAEPVEAPATAVEEDEPSPAEPVAPVEEEVGGEPTPIAAREAESGPPPRPIPVAAPVPFPAAPPSPARPREEVPAVRTAGRDAAPSLVARFRALRGASDDNGEPDTSEILAVVSRFPDGWARRRAVMSFLRRGCPADLGDALSIIEELERPTDRRWACATLIDSRELSEDDAGRILERFPFPALARRLRRRSGSDSSGD